MNVHKARKAGILLNGEWVLIVSVLQSAQHLEGLNILNQATKAPAMALPMVTGIRFLT